MSTMSNERGAPSEPFEHEREVTADPAVTHDDISAAQTEARAAARISGEHEEGLLYQPATSSILAAAARARYTILPPT